MCVCVSLRGGKPLFQKALMSQLAVCFIGKPQVTGKPDLGFVSKAGLFWRGSYQSQDKLESSR